MRGKKGQITVFIIIGLILLIGAGIYFYLQSETQQIQGVPTIAQVPQALDPVNMYITKCLSLTTQQAISTISDQGGYADPIASGMHVNDASPTDKTASAVRFAGDLIIPYWLYAEGNNENNCADCSFKSQKPYLYKQDGSPSIQQAIETKIEQNIDICLGNFAALQNQGFSVEKQGTPQVETTIIDDGVYAKLTYPLKIRQAEQEFTINEFLTQEKVRLKEIYGLASQLMQMQANYTYFENQFRELLAYYSRVDNQALPPPAASGFDLAGGERWVKEQVKQHIQNIIEQYTPLTQVYGTANYEPYYTSDDTSTQMLNQVMLIPINEDHTSIGVHFMYSNLWPMYFDLNCNGQICEAQSLTQNFIAMFGLQQYNFAYDVSYPVLVELTDNEAFNGKGISFKYFLESNVRNNLPFSPGEIPLPDLGLGNAGSLFCDRESFTSGTVTIRTIARQQPAPDSIVSYHCGEISCVIGNTNEQGILTTALPRCAGGILKAQLNQQFSYPASANIDTFTDANQTTTLNIEPQRSYKVNAQRFLLKKIEKYGPWTVQPVPTRIGQKENVLVTLTRVTQGNDEPFSAITILSGNANDTPETDFRLVPGTYNTQITDILEQPIHIPEDVRDIDTGFFQGIALSAMDLFTDEDITQITFPEINLEQSVLGGAQFTWTVTADQLDAGNTLTFTTIDTDLDNTPEEMRIVEDLSEIGNIANYSIQYRSMLEPQITTS